MDRLNQLQQRFLKDCFERANRSFSKYSISIANDEQPQNVKVARALVKKWDSEQTKRYSKLRDRKYAEFQERTRKAREVIFFSEPAAALKALKEYERYVSGLKK